MKIIKILTLSIAFLCCGVTQEVNAQMIINNTPCTFTVKANYVPSGSCAFTGVGPLVTIAPSATMALLPPLPGDWISGYGVNRPGGPPRVVTDASCPGPTVRNIGVCAGVMRTITFVPGGDLDIN